MEKKVPVLLVTGMALTASTGALPGSLLQEAARSAHAGAAIPGHHRTRGFISDPASEEFSYAAVTPVLWRTAHGDRHLLT